MIWAAVVIGKDGDFVITQVSITIIGGCERFNVLIVQGKTVGLFAGLLVVHGILVRVLSLCKDLQNLTSSGSGIELRHYKVSCHVHKRFRLCESRGNFL